MMTEKLTAKEAAALLGYRLDYVGRLLRAGAIKSEEVAGAIWLIDRSEVGWVKWE